MRITRRGARPAANSLASGRWDSLQCSAQALHRFSLCLRLIKRFSEDIDLVVDKADLGFGGDAGPEKAPSKKKRRERLEALSRAGFLVRPALFRRLAQVTLGRLGIAVTTEHPVKGFFPQADLPRQFFETDLGVHQVA